MNKIQELTQKEQLKNLYLLCISEGLEVNSGVERHIDVLASGENYQDDWLDFQGGLEEIIYSSVMTEDILEKTTCNWADGVMQGFMFFTLLAHPKFSIPKLFDEGMAETMDEICGNGHEDDFLELPETKVIELQKVLEQLDLVGKYTFLEENIEMYMKSDKSKAKNPQIIDIDSLSEDQVQEKYSRLLWSLYPDTFDPAIKLSVLVNFEYTPVEILKKLRDDIKIGTITMYEETEEIVKSFLENHEELDFSDFSWEDEF